MHDVELAIFGGKPEISNPLPSFNSIGPEEKAAVVSVMDSGVLSSFYGKLGEGFLGGPKVNEFEKDVTDYFKVGFAITVNSWTSGLTTMVSALDLEPGEIITSSWTMCATAAAIIHAGHEPVFADISPVDFCIDPIDLETKISSRTRAILVVDIFGGSAPMQELLSVAQKYGLKVICDSAQSPGGKYNGHFTGTLGDIGGFSLNYHKHIHTGEGGIIVTNDEELAFKCQLLRNHAEACVPNPFDNKLIGHNYRLGEIECAIGIEQLKKLDGLISRRKFIANQVIDLVDNYDFLKIPIKEGIDHVYYVIPMLYEAPNDHFSRKWFVSALQAEGLMNVYEGFSNVHRLPFFQERSPKNSRLLNTENLHDNNFVCFQNCMYQMDSPSEIKLMLNAIKKISDYVEKIQDKQSYYFACDDAGAAYHIACFIRCSKALSGPNRYFEVKLGEPAKRVFREILSSDQLKEIRLVEKCSEKIDVSIIGTGNGFEAKEIDTSLTLGVKVYALFDNWTSYRQRLVIEDRKLNVNGIIVTDEKAKRLASDCYPATRVFLTRNFIVKLIKRSEEYHESYENSVLIAHQPSKKNLKLYQCPNCSSEFLEQLFLKELSQIKSRLDLIQPDNRTSEKILRPHPTILAKLRISSPRYLKGFQISTRPLIDDLLSCGTVIGVNSYILYLAQQAGKKIMQIDFYEE